MGDMADTVLDGLVDEETGELIDVRDVPDPAGSDSALKARRRRKRQRRAARKRSRAAAALPGSDPPHG